MSDFDVAIVGAGPAGALAATLLARRGRSVAMFDPDPRDNERIGESLPAFAADMLERHNMPGPLSDNRHRPITGTISKWGGLRTEDDALMRPGVPDWRLDRRVFDASLRRVALSEGVIHLKSTAQGFERTPCCWSIKADDGNRIAATWLIDATGRRAIIARRHGGPRHRQPPQVGVWAVGQHLTGTTTAKTLIETQDNGWWYGAVLPSGRPIAAYHSTSARASEIRRRPDIWHRLFGHTEVLSVKLSPGAFAGARLCFADATGTATQNPVGDTWIACGDAAIAFDPLASQGLLHAIRTGIAAADVASGRKTRDSYRTEMQSVWSRYLILHEMTLRRAAVA